MLTIFVPEQSMWDEYNCVFVPVPGGRLDFEHSLFTISKWEAKWKKSFFDSKDKTEEEMFDYIKMMVVNDIPSPDIFSGLTKEDFETIGKYMNDSMTATTIKQQKKGNRNGELMTSELVYYYMIALNIPHEYEHWHINRLMTLINVCAIKQESPQKMSKKDLYSQNAKLNAARHAARKR